MVASIEPQRQLRSAKYSSLWLICACFLVSSCSVVLGGDSELTKRTYMELVDWHVSGLWVINSPVAWVRVRNYNTVPIHNIVFQYNTFDSDGTPLDQSTYTIEETVPAGASKNFIELYLGMINLHSDKLALKLLSVSKAD